MQDNEAICTELIKMVHRCVQEECPRFDRCLNALSICIYRQPREVVRDVWEVWQFVLHAKEKNGVPSFLETKYLYDGEELQRILDECREDLACKIELSGDQVKFTI